MTPRLLLAEPQAPADLDTFLGRAVQILDGSARIVSAGGVLAVYVPVLFPTGLLDDSATILGLRTFALAAPADDGEDAGDVDSVVPMASLRARAAGSTASGEGFELGVPTPVYSVTWAGVVPPRSGWTPLGVSVPSAVLAEAAEQGIREVAAAIPDSAGDAIVRQVRALVWGEADRGRGGRPARGGVRRTGARLPSAGGRRAGPRRRLRGGAVDAPHTRARARAREAALLVARRLSGARPPTVALRAERGGSACDARHEGQRWAPVERRQASKVFTIAWAARSR